MSMKMPKEGKVTIGNYAALIFAMIFFSGLCQVNAWYSIFDFITLSGSFGTVVRSVTESSEGLKTAMTSFRGVGGSGARDGFIQAFMLVPTIMFALGVINILEYSGALEAARKLLSPLLRPLMGIPGSSGLALIASLQSSDAGAAMTRQLRDNGHLTKRETDVFTMFQFSAGASIVGLFSAGAAFFTMTNDKGEYVVASSVGVVLVVILVFKFIGANIFRLYLNFSEGKEDKNTPTETPVEEKA